MGRWLVLGAAGVVACAPGAGPATEGVAVQPREPSQVGAGREAAPAVDAGGASEEVGAVGDAARGPAAPPTDAPVAEAVRFVVLGDGGEGNAAQRQVGERAALICEARGCDFALYLGDNFYDTGVSSVDDEQFQTKFEQPYQDLDVPFYVVLGNHDYGGDGLGIDPDRDKARYQIAYSDLSAKWTMPDVYYSVRVGDVQLYALDTNALMWGRDVEGQARWLADALDDSDARWQLAFGHHPYISNGSHGNAGHYEGLASFIPIAAGTSIRDFVESEVCGRVHVYFAGHDHTRQWLKPACGTQFVVSGAAAKTTPLARRDDNPVEFEDDQSPGFLWVEVQGDLLRAVFYDLEGEADFETTLGRAALESGGG